MASISRTKADGVWMFGVFWSRFCTELRTNMTPSPPSVADGKCMCKFLQEAIQVQQEWTGKRCGSTMLHHEQVGVCGLWCMCAAFPLRCRFFVFFCFRLAESWPLFRPMDVFRQLNCTNSSHFPRVRSLCSTRTGSETPPLEWPGESGWRSGWCFIIIILFKDDT